MTAIDPGVTATQPNPFANIGLTQPAGNGTAAGGNGAALDSASLGLTGANFMNLLLAQVKNQDPMNPMDSTAFLGQLAQLSTVSGIQQLNDGFSSLSASLTSNQALQAANLVGHQAQTTSPSLQWDGTTPVTAQAVLPIASGNVQVAVMDAAGQFVTGIALGSQPAGNASFTWDGTNADGNKVAPGTYTLVATATDNNTTTALQTLTNATITGVGLGGVNGLTLDLAGVGTVPFNDVKSIR
ncbi:MAG: flagellar biosynthesis protein FlgD [Nevskiaceae bacterium]|nr:MAG: flagellar biosynthesis protein FlgD [Nevskiaceae bacterium]TBR71556.1 MAG: flagellar biosynthesis protein FlgD [Nevskiaceae bacterium]